jgi:predicted PhzF superfamily epimerase YddE/YHI9
VRIPFQQIDAFADAPFTGNPAAVMPLEAWLDDATLQAIAAENNLSETAFIVPWTGGDADFELRWFTPELEVGLCGHATLATGHALLSARQDASKVRFATRKAGILEVARDGEGYSLSLPAWEVTPKPLPDFVPSIGGRPVETHWRDGGYALLLYGSAAEVEQLCPDFRALRPHGDIMFIATAQGSDTDVVSRVFVPGAGIDEDPVTGSAHCILTTFWAKRLGRDRFTAYQASARGGYVGCRIEGDRAVLSGRCVTLIEGAFGLG